MTVTLATFMEVLDTSIANVALPHIAGNLSISQDEATWVLTSYLVANAMILPISAWLSTNFGRKRFYMTCVVIFGISSLMCGLAPNLTGVGTFPRPARTGGGGLAPTEQAILADTFPPKNAAGILGLCHGGGGGAGDRAYTRGLHHRQLQLAMAVLDQRSGRPALSGLERAHAGRSAVSLRIAQADVYGRLRWPGPARHRNRLPASDPR